MPSIKAHIDEAIVRLELKGEVTSIDQDVAVNVVELAETRFTQIRGVRWWWEVLKPELDTASMMIPDDGYQIINQICPEGLIWLIASDEADGKWPVYSAEPKHIVALLGECRFFEYILVAQDYSWIVLETHHNQFIAVGQPVADRLSRLKTSH